MVQFFEDKIVVPHYGSKVDFASLSDQVRAFVQEKQNTSILLQLLYERGTPYEPNYCESKFQTRQSVLAILYQCCEINFYTHFLLENNCKVHLLEALSENLSAAK